ARGAAAPRPGSPGTPLEVGRTPAEQADAYAALLDALGLRRAAVVAISGGGPSALQFALRHGDRCRGLALISALARRRPVRERPLGQKVFDAVICGSDRLPWLRGRLVGPGGPPGRQALAQLLELPEGLRGAGRRNDLAQFAALPDDPPAGISVPTLVVHGTADRIVPIAHAEAVAGA